MPHKADLGKATWLGTYRISRITWQLYWRWGVNNQKCDVNSQATPHEEQVTFFFVNLGSQEEVRGYQPPGDAVTHSYRSFPPALGICMRCG